MDSTFSNLFAGILFGSIGFAAWRYGRARDSAPKMLLGFALMGFPWVTPEGTITWLIGAALTALLFLPI